MPFEPDYMTQLERYYAEARRLRTWEDWTAFEAKWLDPSRWPRKKLPAADPLSPDAENRLERDGRRWARSVWVYDLTAEARYHYFAVLLGPGMAVRFPHLAQTPDKSGSRWSRLCAYCEISTTDRGRGACPICGRTLLHEHFED
jgi:hypothetical protein